MWPVNRSIKFGITYPPPLHYILVTILNPLVWYSSLNILSLNKKKSGWFGVNIKKNSTEVSATLSTGSGYASGLYVHDEILAINNYRVSSENLKDAMTNTSVGEAANFLISRDGLIKTISVTAGSLPFDKYNIEKIESPTSRQKQLFEGWLKQDWDA